MLARLKDAPRSLQDHELLEILLFNAIPRKNTNPIAHALLDAFGSLANVFDAEMEQLMSVNGVGAECAAYLKVISYAMQKADLSKNDLPVIYTPQTALQLAERRLKRLHDEAVEIYCIDENCKVRFVQRFTSFKADGVTVTGLDISKVLAAHRPSRIVVAHNHPFGSELPSDKDNEFTKNVCLFCSLSGIVFSDHIIVGSKQSFSYALSEKYAPMLKDPNAKSATGRQK